MDCEYPIYVTTLPFNDINTTADKMEDYSNTCLGNYDNGDDIIYQIAIAGTQCVDITVTGATPIDNSIGVVLDNVCPPSSSCIAQATTAGTVATISNLTLAPGTYYLMIDRRPQQGNNSLHFRLSITDCAAALGACCFLDGHCEQRTESACSKFGGLAWTVDTPCVPSPCPFGKGDVNCDHALNSADIPWFVDAVMGNYTGCDITLADMNDSGAVNGVDIQIFVNVLLGI